MYVFVLFVFVCENIYVYLYFYIVNFMHYIVSLIYIWLLVI